MKIVVDDTLEFSFATPWTAIDWDNSPERHGLKSGNSTVDIVGHSRSPECLLLEAKDYRQVSSTEAVSKGAESALIWLADWIERKVDGTIDDLGQVEEGANAGFCKLATRRWTSGVKRIIFWFEPHAAAYRGRDSKTRMQGARALQQQVLALLRPRLSRHEANVRVMSLAGGDSDLPWLAVRSVNVGVARRRQRTPRPR